MTREEAIDLLDNLIGMVDDNHGSDYDGALRMAIADMEKQIPKKPSFVDTRFRQRGVRYGEYVTLDRCYKCPSCNTHIFHDFDSEVYCEDCGQKLDWSEERK